MFRFLRRRRRGLAPVVSRLVLAATLTLPGPGAVGRLAAQDGPLTLAAALDQAARGAFANRAARAATDAADARVLATRRGMLPSVRVEAGFLRTTDPVGAFGTTLRQQRITPADFDPARLNFPAPLNNYAGALVLEQPLVAVDAWLATRAGSRAAQSASHAADWTAIATQAEVVRAWYGHILATEKATTLDSAARAAHAHVRQAEHMLEVGLVTRSDALLAAVRAGELDAARLEAQGDSALAGRRLAVLLGRQPDEALAMAATFPTDDAIIGAARDVMAMRAARRADVEGARLGREAAAADVARARAAMLPRIGSFVRRDLHSASAPFGGASNWTVGVMASWTPFSGAAELAEHRTAMAHQQGAQAQLDGVAAQAALEQEETALALATALSRLQIARQAVAQGAEAHRIVTRKYEGGLATVVELLDASAAETQVRLGLSAARFALIAATADRLKAIGAEPARLAALEAR